MERDDSAAVSPTRCAAFEGCTIIGLDPRWSLSDPRCRAHHSALDKGSPPCEHYLVLNPELRSFQKWPQHGLGYEGQRSITSTDDSLTAVIDIGSGSARAEIIRLNPGGGIEPIAQQVLNLNLMSYVDADGALDPEGVAGVLDAIEDFAYVCSGYGIKEVNAVGTAALRESLNGFLVTDSARRKHGVTFRIIDGYEEAAYCFIGAIHGLPVARGLLADLGGGSTEIVRFARRSLKSLDSLSLGSLRISNMFRLTDKPSSKDLASAFQHATDLLSEAHIPSLDERGSLVGSGGSMRLLAKLDRRRTAHPVPKMHGYYIDADGLGVLMEMLASATSAQRADIPGMNPQRTHSIVGGAVIAQALLTHTKAKGIVVSGQGLREGLARHPSPIGKNRRVSLPKRSRVRADGLSDLVQRFAPRFSRRGTRRANIAGRIAETAWQGHHRRLTSSLRCAALLLDIGSSIDFYNRYDRAAALVTRPDLPGFTHRECAQIAAILLAAEDKTLIGPFLDSEVLTRNDKRLVGRAAAILLATDEIERRLAPEFPPECVTISREEGKGSQADNDATITIVTPAWARASAPHLHERWNSEFDQPLSIVRG